MADPKRKEEADLEAILGAMPDDEPLDLDALAAEADENGEIDFDALQESGSSELEAVKAERDDMRDRFMRSLADLENTRKRAERDRREAEQYGGTKLARDLLPVFDNLSRALEAATGKDGAADKALIEGVQLTLRELLNIYEKHGISQINPEIGDKFDPLLHQAMFEAPLPGTKAGDIIQVMTPGFKLNERLLRPAQVGVSSTPAS